MAVTQAMLDLVNGLSDADAAAALNARPPVAKPSNLSSTYVTYLGIGELPSPFNAQVAGRLRNGLLAWVAGTDLSQINPSLPNPGQFSVIHSRLDAYPGVDMSSPQAPALLSLFSSGIPGILEPLLTVDQAATLLAIGYTRHEAVTAEEVSAARAAASRAATIASRRALVVSRYNTAIGMLEGDTVPTEAELLAAMGAA